MDNLSMDPRMDGIGCQTCQERGLDPVGRGVPNAGPDGDSLGSLIDHILAAHHLYLKGALPRLEALLDQLLAQPDALDAAAPRSLAAAFRPMRRELDGHLAKEETVLFPLIRGLEQGVSPRDSHCGSVLNPIRVMTWEHDSATGALAHLRQLTNGYTPPADASPTCRALYAELAELESDLHQHIHLENEILFPRAVRLEAGE